MEYKTIKRIRHNIYDDEKEFKIDHPNTTLKNWREGDEGDWVWSDDNRIIQLLKVKKNIAHHNDRKNYSYAKGYCRTVVGTFLNTPRTFMDTDFEQHQNRYTFSKTIKNTASRVRERKNPTSKEKVFATNVAVGMGVVKAYMDAFSEEDNSKAQKKAVVLLKQDRVMSEIEKSVQDVAKSLGINHNYVLNGLKALVESSPDENIALQSLKELGKAIGTLGGGAKIKDQGVIGLFSGFSPEQIETAQRQVLTDGKEV